MDALMTIGFINIIAALVMAGASMFDGFRAHKALHISEEPDAITYVPAAIIPRVTVAPPPPGETVKRHAVRGPNGRFVKKG